ncbi:MAG TPA: hypothetical protein VHR97_05625 [Candidatus Baltobacteraceae bacterium]|jgi:hypothetical protein|nr:hypothetical protein [Candidatus Baltobacteraceae bacterium]
MYASTGWNVDVFDFPSGTPEGQLGGFDQGFEKNGLCLDGANDLFVAGWNHDSLRGQTYEFAPGGQTPIEKLTTRGIAHTCSVDPTTGNLAVAEIRDKSGDPHGAIAVFAGAQGSPAYYIDLQTIEFRDCAFDNAGNLYISQDSQGNLVELAQGSQTFETIALNAGAISGSLQWYDGELLVSSWTAKRSRDTIDQVQITGSMATIVGTTLLDGKGRTRSADQYVVGGGIIVGPGDNDKYLEMWNYPAGGRPTKNLGRGNPGTWQSVAIST